MNETLIQALIDVLRREEQALTELTATFLAQETAITKNRLDTLEQITHRQEDLRTTVAELEKQRVVYTMQLAIALGYEETITLSVIADRLGGEWGTLLHNLRKQLMTLSQEVRDAGKNTVFLLTYSVRTVDHLLRILTGTKGTGPIYSRMGKISTPSGHRSIINHEV
jgi:flagellar biosynthesis/type III secretory pathway chaperone